MRTMRATLPTETCLSAKQIRSVFADGRYVALVATSSESFAGFALGFFHTFAQEPEIASIGDDDIFHLCLNIISPEFQGCGIGLQLIEARIAEAKRRGARNCTSFARSGASLHNMHKVGGHIIGVRKNYAGSGETFHIVQIDMTEQAH